jgi:hypothetical protein
VQTGQFTAAKRDPNYNRITDKYPPRQACGARGGADGPVRGQAGPRGSARPRALGRVSKELHLRPAAGVGSQRLHGDRAYLGYSAGNFAFSCRYSLIDDCLLFGYFSALEREPRVQSHASLCHPRGDGNHWLDGQKVPTPVYLSQASLSHPSTWGFFTASLPDICLSQPPKSSLVFSAQRTLTTSSRPNYRSPSPRSFP